MLIGFVGDAAFAVDYLKTKSFYAESVARGKGAECVKHLDADKNYAIKFEHSADSAAFSHRPDFILVSVGTPDRKARVHISPAGTLPQLHSRIDRFLQDWAMKLQPKRPHWDEYFMSIAKAVSTRSNCIKRKVTAIIVKDRRVISTGYNGTPRGVKNCAEGGCPRCNSFAAGGTKLDECRCSHAEENAIVQAAYHGVTIRGASIYTTFSPCMTCAKMIVNAGITEVVFSADYPLAENASQLLKEAKVATRKYQTT